MSLPKSQNQQLIPISAASKLLGVSVDTIRRWEKKGLLQSTRPNGKDRYFSVDDLKEFQATKTLSTSEAAKHLGVCPTTLRRLDKKGLIKANRNTNGARIFSAESLKNINEQITIPKLRLKHISDEYLSIPQIKPKLTTVEELLDMSRKEAEKQYTAPLTEGKLQEYASVASVITSGAKQSSHKITTAILEVHNNKLTLSLLSGTLASLFLAILILARVSNFQLPWQQKEIVRNQVPSAIDQNVLAATTSNYYIDLNSDLILEKDLAVGGSINRINIIPGGDSSVKNLTVSVPAVTLDQDLSTTSSPTFQGLTVLSPINAPSASTSTLNLTGTKDQITFNVSGVKSTLSWTPTSAVTLTLPNITDTLVSKTSTDTLTNKTITAGDNTLTGSFTGITGLGTIGTGTWNGTKIGATYGGTGITTYTTGDLLYSSASNTLANLAVGTNGQVLTISSGLPTWGAAAACADCIVTDPSTAQSITPTVADITTLTLQAAPSGTANIFDVKSNDGLTSYFSVDSSGKMSSSAFQLTDINNAVVGTAVPNGWTLGAGAYTYRRILTVTNNDGSNTLPINHQVTLSLTGATATDVCSNSLSNANDIRVAYSTNGSTFTEIARNITRTCGTPTVDVSFQLQGTIAPSTSNTNYYLYYGNSSIATTPSTYTYDTVTLDDGDTVGNWTSNDGTNFTLSQETTIRNNGTGSVKAVAATPTWGNAGTFSTTGQGQLLDTTNGGYATTATVGGTTYLYSLGGGWNTNVSKSQLNSSGDVGAFTNSGQGPLPLDMGSFYATTATIGSTTYMYIIGGVSQAYVDQSTVYRATIDSSGNVSAFSTTGQTQLSSANQIITGITHTTGGTTYVYVPFAANSTLYRAQIDTSGNVGAFDTTGQGQEPINDAFYYTKATFGGTTYVYALRFFGNGVYRAEIDELGNMGAFSATGQSQTMPQLNNIYPQIATAGGVNYIYLIGGQNGGSVRQSTVYRAALDSSGNVGAFSTTNQSQLPQLISNGQAATATIGGTSYLYFLGGVLDGFGNISTVYKSTISNPPTYTATKTLSSTDLSGKGSISFYVYSSRTGSYSNLEFSEDGNTWQTTAYTISQANTWEGKSWDISGLSSSVKDAVTSLRFNITDSTTGFTMYMDNITAVPSAYAGTAPIVSAASKVLGSSNLALNAQGTGLVAINYDANSLAGTGGLNVYNGGTTSLFSVGSSGAITATGAMSGVLGITTTGDILPSTNNTYNLGSNTARWQDIYLGPASIHLGTSTTDEYKISYDTTNNRLGFNVNGSGNDEIVFDSSGFVGIGTTSPTVALDVVGSALITPATGSTTALTLRAAPTGANNIFDVLSNDGTTSYFSIDSSGQMSASAFKLTDSAKAIIGTAIPGAWENIATVPENDFTYRRAVSVTATGNLAANYEVTMDISTPATASQIYSNTYNQADPYRDFRLFYTTNGGSSYTEVPKNVSAFTNSRVTFTFQLQAQIDDAQTSSTNYYLFYSNSAYAGMSTPPTYTGDLNWDSHTESTTGWTSADSAYQLSTTTSPTSQAGTYSLKEIATVDRMGTFAITNQGQLGATLNDLAAITTTIGSSTYVYVVGGNTGAADVATIYKSTISSNNLSAFATTAYPLPQELSGASGVISSSADIGTGALGPLNLTDGTGCPTGADFDWNGTTCTIKTTRVYNYTTITIPPGKILTANQGIIPTLKATTSVSITGTGSINLDGKGSAAGAGDNPGSNGGGTGCARGGGGGGGHGAAGGAGASVSTNTEDGCSGAGGAGPRGEANANQLALGSGGGNSAGAGGAGGGAIKIISAGNITIEASSVISANGANAAGTGGGGGSGGSIVLQSYGSIGNSGTIRANGGHGSDNSATYNDATGGGGGGGGGLITLQDADGSIAGTITATGGNGSAGYEYHVSTEDTSISASAAGSTFTVSPSILSTDYYLYVLGGKNGLNYRSTVYKATLNSTTGDTSTELATTSQDQLDAPLTGHTTLTQTVNGSNFIYVLGGYTGSAYVSSVYKSTINGTGDIVAFATTSQGQLPLLLSNHAQATVTIGSTTYLYVVGGKSGDSTYMSTVYKSNIDPTSGDIQAFTTTSQGQLPVALYDLSATTATVGSVNYIYVFGGNNGSANVSTVYRATIDGSGNIGAFSTTGHTQLNAILSGHQTVTNTSSGTTYFYTIGGTSASAVSTVYRSTTTSDMTNFYIEKKISDTGIDLSNKNDITFSFYSTDNVADLMEVAFSEDDTSPTYSHTYTFRGNPADGWRSIDWDISSPGIAAADKNSVKWIRFKVNTARTTEFTTYIDNIQVQTEATGNDTTSALTSALGAANLTLNAQGTGLVRVNYSDPADPTNFPNLAGSGGLVVYDGSNTAIFSVGSTGAITATGGLTFSGVTTDITTVSNQDLIISPNGTGKVGIGTTAPGYLLQVGNAGDGSEARANAWNSLSDSRLKENVASISGALDKVLALNGVSFDWISNGQKSLGFVAQEVEGILPEVVSTGIDGYKSINYSAITPIIIEALKELNTNIDLRFKNNDLKISGAFLRIKDLEDKLASISAQIQSSNSADLASVSTQSNISELNLTPPEQLLATNSAKLVDLSVTSDATFSGQLAAYSATISDTFKSLGNTYLGNTSIAGDFNIDGTMNISRNSISTLDALYIQNGPLAGDIDFFNGQVIIDNQGNIKVGGNLEIEGAITISAFAGENLKTGDAVYISADKTVSKADSIIAGKTGVVGLVLSGVNKNQPVIVAINGKINGLTNLKAGSKYYLGQNGQLTTTLPSSSVKNIQVGVGFSSTQLLIQIFDFNGLIN
ncbi:MAG: MerR family transcriptional regulator [Candidatus Daviesbacteria bacterium]|nr:MerR family transcriptional regulator [Candidatus Daviesbacteria bacterium]